MNMSLKEMADVLGLALDAKYSENVRGISTDSRTIEEGMVFFALCGKYFNGVSFLEQAFQKGACAAVVDEKSILESFGDRILLPVEDTLFGLQKVAHAYRRKFNIAVIAITGSNGKTTTKEMISAVLSTKFYVGKSIGNFNNQIGVPLSICRWDPEIGLAVVEMGTNHFGEIQRLCEIAHPTQGIITNIGKGHLEFFKDLNGVAKAKGELLQYLGKKGLALLNGDDPYIHSIRNFVGNTVLFGFSEGCDVRGEVVGFDDFGFPQMKVNGVKIKLSIPGRHNLYNGLAAFAIGQCFGIPKSEIQHVLNHWQPYEKRLNVKRISDIVVVDDTYNANPSSVEQAVLTLSSMRLLKRRFVILGDMLELGSSSQKEHEKIGVMVADLGIDAFYGYGEEIRFSVEQAQKNRIGEAIQFSDKQQLISYMTSQIKPGDGILIKGSRGMQMEDVVEGFQKALNRDSEES